EIDHVAAILKVIADVGGDVVVVLDHQHAHGMSRLTRIRAPLRKLSEKRAIALRPSATHSAIRPQYLHARIGAGHTPADMRTRRHHACLGRGRIIGGICPELEREGLAVTPTGYRGWR